MVGIANQVFGKLKKLRLVPCLFQFMVTTEELISTFTTKDTVGMLGSQ